MEESRPPRVGQGCSETHVLVYLVIGVRFGNRRGVISGDFVTLLRK